VAVVLDITNHLMVVLVAVELVVLKLAHLYL
jgi:hypothetical protein